MRDTVQGQVFDPYLGAGAPVTVLIGLLSLFAAAFLPQVAVACCLMIVFLLAGLMIPAPIAGIGTLLDRPLVEMLIFVPLSLLGAAGVAGLVRSFKSRCAYGIAAFIAIAVAVHALTAYSFDPSPCCTIVGNEDRVAIDWLKSNASAWSADCHFSGAASRGSFGIPSNGGRRRCRRLDPASHRIDRDSLAAGD